MYHRPLEDIASKRPAELRAERAATASPGTAPAGHQRQPIRTHTGWVLISIGLRLAASGSR